MLEALGLESLDELVEKAVPASIRSATPMALPPVRNERDTLTYLRRMADRNTIMNSMIGMGYYGTFLPGVIQRNVLENPGWYTAYTPYQAEVSQRSEEHTSELQSLMRISYAVFCLKKKKKSTNNNN